MPINNSKLITCLQQRRLTAVLKVVASIYFSPMVIIIIRSRFPTRPIHRRQTHALHRPLHPHRLFRPQPHHRRLQLDAKQSQKIIFYSTHRSVSLNTYKSCAACVQIDDSNCLCSLIFKITACRPKMLPRVSNKSSRIKLVSLSVLG